MFNWRALFRLRNHRLSLLIRFLVMASIFIVLLIIAFRSCSPLTTHPTTYFIGEDNQWKGLDLMGKEPNLTGFNHDLLAAISQKEELPLRVVIVPEKNLLEELEKGTLQGIVTSLQPTHAHENRFLFSNLYFRLGPVLIIRQTAPIKGWNEKAKKIVGVQANSPTILDLEQDPSIQIKLYEDILSALSDLSKGQIDGVIFPALPAHIYTRTFYEHELKIVSAPLNDEGLRLVTLKNEEGKFLIERFNEGLQALEEDGFYRDLLHRWGFVDVERFDHQ